MTNKDKLIWRMIDDDRYLVNELVRCSDCSPENCPAYEYCQSALACSDLCEDNIEYWLKQEAED